MYVIPGIQVIQTGSTRETDIKWQEDKRVFYLVQEVRKGEILQKKIKGGTKLGMLTQNMYYTI